MVSAWYWRNEKDAIKCKNAEESCVTSLVIGYTRKFDIALNATKESIIIYCIGLEDQIENNKRRVQTKGMTRKILDCCKNEILSINLIERKVKALC